MRLRIRRLGAAAALMVVVSAGCHTLNNNNECGCSNDPDNHERWSDEWYCAHTNSPTGARQKCHKGKLWPPFPRPSGPKQEYWHRFHTAHYWPHPYNTQDLQYLRTVSGSQVANGWTNEMTLFAHHFDAKTNELNHAGNRKLKWIVQIAPAQRRQIWIATSDDKAVDAARVGHVQKQATNLAFDGNVPAVALRVAPVDGRPTDQINRIRAAETNTMPVPRIPFAIGGNGAASGAGALGGASGGGGGASGP